MFLAREATPADHAYIYKSFLNDHQRGYPTNQVAKAVYFRQHHDVIEFLLTHASIIVLSFPEDPRELAGFIIFQQLPDALVLHWICIAGDYRRKHFAAGLVANVLGDRRLVIATHIVDKFSILKHKLPGCTVTFDPYFIANERIRYARGGHRLPVDPMPGASER